MHETPVMGPKGDATVGCDEARRLNSHFSIPFFSPSSSFLIVLERSSFFLILYVLQQLYSSQCSTFFLEDFDQPAISLDLFLQRRHTTKKWGDRRECVGRAGFLYRSWHADGVVQEDRAGECP